ncbi:NAD(P)H-hydrate dehydratase [Corynebacterium sp. P3-F1]|uniref:bifunctional ADP-dependent NAD(P)H-hydrate dehydratase/NAD(P)H-hydrate epimerase n=1 Tax=Corynebacterium sp. P3-F1 TaxID=3059080 RepID=UPI00265CCA30|nr:bifunctional ADP-dependent NAD(P)H-hydrate dehydratase/NAD(P)H-hydrate epimerase [Corynebacterium sp. P3-F1]WKK60570.1 NAD(P)H-hydrate dehydratase [Corynebacterium sp. P3-F1]
MVYAYTAEQIRAAEKPLLETQAEPDELMKSAAHAVFEAAETMLTWPDPLAFMREKPKTLLIVGKGGNGGDALYAGTELALAGHTVDAWLAWGSAHEPALEAFRNAGGTVLKETPRDLRDYRFAIDGLTGLGGAGGLDEETGRVIQGLADWYAHVLAVDVPSGIDADTGEVGAIHVTADATVTFGGWRLAHGLAPECGIQLLADPHLADGRSISGNLDPINAAAALSRAVSGTHEWPETLTELRCTNVPNLEPRFHDDKYSGGVVGIRAGSDTYPGAAILCVAGAVNATPSMVRYAGPQAMEVVRAWPEVVVTRKLEDAGRVQAWVFGPGVGTGSTADSELAYLLGREEPLLIDADGLTLLSLDPELRKLLRNRAGQTVLTPHDGEFARFRDAEGIEASGNRLAETRALAEALNCIVLRKGRSTIMCNARHDGTDSIVDAGTSWAATPGSGDVLAGVVGAHLAQTAARWGNDAFLSDTQPVVIHGVASALAARTEYGDGPTHASAIARAVPAATAKLNRFTGLPAASTQR